MRTMVRTTYHLTEQQVESLKAIADRTGLGLAELIRRAVDLFVREESKQLASERKEP